MYYLLFVSYHFIFYHPATQYFFWYPTQYSVAGNPKYQVLPDIVGKPRVLGITRYFRLPATQWFSKLNIDISGITWYFWYSQTWLGIAWPSINVRKTYQKNKSKIFGSLPTKKQMIFNIPYNTLKYLDLPESKKDIRKYSIVHFNTPAPPKPDSLPGISLFFPIPDPILKKNLPVGHWW